MGVQVTRNEILRTTETPTRNPWRFIMGVPNSLRYSSSRAILESLDLLDRRTPQNITFSNNPNLRWMFRYQGQSPVDAQGVMTNVLIQPGSSSGTTFEFLYTGIGGSFTGFVFRAGDIIQILNDSNSFDAYPYPFTITEDVYLQNARLTPFTAQVHRPLFFTPGDISAKPVGVGSWVRFNMLCQNMPTYTLTPGGFLADNTPMTTSPILNNALISWDDSFDLVEYTADAPPIESSP